MPNRELHFEQRDHTKILKERQYREVFFDRASVDVDARTVEVAFSSEEPVDRWFGPEVLDHDKKSVRMERLKSGRAAGLVNHDRDKLFGVIDSATIDDDRRGRSVLRFGRSVFAEEVFQDVIDGVRASISFGYRIFDYKRKYDDEGNVIEVRVVDWEPYEISFVSVPADITVGVGRDMEEPGSERNEQLEAEPQEDRNMAKPNETPQGTGGDNQRQHEVANHDELRSEGRASANDEFKRMLRVATQHDAMEVLDDVMGRGGDLNDLNAAILDKRSTSNAPSGETEVPDTDSRIGMTQKDTDEFSILRAIRACASGKWDRDAPFERDASRAVADKLGKEPNGFYIPQEVQSARAMSPEMVLRALTAGGQGTNLIATDLMSQSFIELLRNAMLTRQMGATVLSGLRDNVAIPKQTAGGTAYWIATEGGDPTAEGAQTLSQVTLSPKTIGAYTDITRQMLMQTSLDAEMFVRGDLAIALALGIDLAALSGTGASGQPTGLLDASRSVPTVTLTTANTPTWTELMEMWSAVAGNNALLGSLGWVCPAAIAGNMKATAKDSGSGRFLMEGSEVDGLPVGVTEQMTTGHLVLGNWRDLVIGEWGALDVNVDTSSLSKSGGVRVVTLQSADIAVRRDESFVDASGV